MIGNNLGLIELTLSGALGLGFCLYQCRDQARHRPEQARAPRSSRAPRLDGA